MGWHWLGVIREALSARMVAVEKPRPVLGRRRQRLVLYVAGRAGLLLGCTPCFLGWLDLAAASKIALYPRGASAVGGE